MTRVWTAVAAVLMGGALGASQVDGTPPPATAWPPAP